MKTRNVGTLEYTAPEILLSEGNYSEKIDVYSFSIVMYELFFEKHAFQEHRESLESSWVLGLNIANKRLRPTMMDVQSEEYTSLSRGEQAYLEMMMLCWANEQTLRPAFPTIHEQLERIINLD
jgi:serine/threonine protein kinase